ncbi:transglycosylase domain-containing protein [Paenibacillus nasutitermitis]|uniref:Penicillin-binding protein 1F n=1 Tax=Paenibacillus nasutitermitis TaxID=1652958 RepID=A0A916Z5A4_9BACL|nr:transglycosylase domain-containing protein [Paenibacillus nasutitermitis]GGD77328.1 penicillin-binding protein 1F [Paenibacillus nasutitermitis]
MELMMRRLESGLRKMKLKQHFRVFSGRQWGYFSFDLCVVGIVFLLFAYLAMLMTGDYMLRSQSERLQLMTTSVITDRNGVQIKKLTSSAFGNRRAAAQEEIPLLLQQAFLATEDHRFYNHSGIDWIGVARAAQTNLAAGKITQGGSTLTQQLARSVFLSNDQTLSRKFLETGLARAMENNYSKPQLLTLYLNHVYMGRQQYGVKAAAERYFGITDLRKLKLWQIASLAAIPKGPSIYNPVDNAKRNKERRAVVLTLMREQGYISKAQMLEAKAVEFVPPAPPAAEVSYTASYTDYVLQEAEAVTGLGREQLLTGGYTIVTGLDTRAQQAAEAAFRQDSLFPEDGATQKVQGAFVLLDNGSGEIRALVGGRDYLQGGLNRAIQIKRQPGSVIKPILVYGPALQSGKFRPQTPLQDKQAAYGSYRPANSNGRYSGTVTLKQAIEQSINAPAVWLLNQVGIPAAAKFAEGLGIRLEEHDRNLAAALGGFQDGVSPLAIAQAFSAFANNGNFNEAHAVRLIKDGQGRTIYARPLRAKQVMTRQTAADMTGLLKGTVEQGTGRKAKLGQWVAGKTGTTQLDVKGVPANANRDLWFAGYTSQLTAAVWMGFDTSGRDNYMTAGSGTAAAMFAAIMKQLPD